MGLAKKIARPIYRRVFEKPLWWFLAKVKIFFISELSERVLEIENQLHKLDNIEEHLRRMEASNAAQWDAMEQLLLAMFAQREPRISESDWKDSASQHIAVQGTVEVNQINGPNAIR